MKTLAQFLKESPDEIQYVSKYGAKRTVLAGTSENQWTFTIFKDSYFVGRTLYYVVHDTLNAFFIEFKDRIKDIANPTDKQLLSIKSDVLSDEDIFHPDSHAVFKISAGTLREALKYEFYDRDFGTTGRIFEEEKIISFWNDFSEISKEDLVQLSAILDPLIEPDISKYRFNHYSRDEKEDSKLYSYDEFYSLIKGAPRVKRDLSHIKHVMDPEAKRLVKSHDKNLPPVKAAEIADKLGMSAAELNAMRMSESFKVGERVNIKGNRGSGNFWEIAEISGEDVYLWYGYPEKKVKFPLSKIFKDKERE